MARHFQRDAPPARREVWEYRLPDGMLGTVSRRQWDRGLKAARSGGLLPSMADAMHIDMAVMFRFIADAKLCHDEIRATGEAPEGRPAWFHNVYVQYQIVEAGLTLRVEEKVLQAALEGNLTAANMVLRRAGVLPGGGPVVNLFLGREPDGGGAGSGMKSIETDAQIIDSSRRSAQKIFDAARDAETQP